MVPSTGPAKQISGGQQDEGHGVVHHVQGEHHQTYFLHHYQNDSIQGRPLIRHVYKIYFIKKNPEYFLCVSCIAPCLIHKNIHRYNN